MLERFQDLVSAHIKWRKETAERIRDGASPELLMKLRSDQYCEIGKWFYGEGASLYDDLPEFIIARNAHLKFHQKVASSVAEDGTLGAEEELAEMLHAFTVLNDKIGHLD